MSNGMLTSVASSNAGGALPPPPLPPPPLPSSEVFTQSGSVGRGFIGAAWPRGQLVVTPDRVLIRDTWPLAGYGVVDVAREDVEAILHQRQPLRSRLWVERTDRLPCRTWFGTSSISRLEGRLTEMGWPVREISHAPRWDGASAQHADTFDEINHQLLRRAKRVLIPVWVVLVASFLALTALGSPYGFIAFASLLVLTIAWNVYYFLIFRPRAVRRAQPVP